MVAGLVFLSDKLSNPEYNIEILILGGGTGSLSRFLTEHFKNITVTNIELSLDMILVCNP
jgi:spermidine synthase